jgi:hypothetical protein
MPTNNSTKNYIQWNGGTAYRKGTPMSLLAKLEEARGKRKRVKLHYGNPATGEAWHTEIGYIGRSTGQLRVLQLVPYRSSIGGGEIETDTIVKLEHANRKHGGEIWNAQNDL